MRNRRRSSLALLGTLVTASPLLAGAGGCGSKDPEAPATFRAVLITDTHVIGAQYTCCVENSAADNTSIAKTVDRLKATRDAVNAIRPAPAMVFVMGDVVHAAHVSRDPQFYRDNDNAYSIARDIFKTFAMPVYLVMGNHDYEVDCGSSSTYDRAFSEARFQELLGTPPYQAVDHGGWKFMLVNSQRGPTFDVADPRCATESASVGAEQMAWAEAQLAEGKPTVVMSHYMRLLYGDVEDGPQKSFPKLLDAHTNVKGFFAGHSHRWLDMTRFNNGVPHRVLGGTRYDADNFWLIELDASGGLRILDEAKGISGTSCASTWSYDGDPQPVAGAVETGDCVSGL
jgi:hypothetical protein